MTDKIEQTNPTGIITKVSGPLVIAKNMAAAKMYEMVRVSEQKLIGEVIELRGEEASIQVYEETSGIGPGETVYLTGESLSLELGPGILENIYDGIQRPLPDIRKQSGDFIARGIESHGLDRSKKWHFTPRLKQGDQVQAGDIIGTVAETEVIEHKIMVPPDVSGKIASIAKDGEYTVVDIIAKIHTYNLKPTTCNLKLMQRWPIRNPRPIKEKLMPTEPLITGQRIIDAFFPITKGGAGSVPGPFGSGKTVIQQQLAKWTDADIVVYVGCGERGNEMTEVLQEFPELIDPKSGKPLMKRTVLVANTSNMPVAAREASVYTGITLAEYYRDMGYKVALMADSTSRWAEAMREMSGRLEEMPGEEGYPAYLGSRTAAFYERAGYVKCLGSDDRKGSLTVIGAVSPPGGDLSEPVTQNTLRVTKVFWALDAQLAYARHYPAINWLNSYSLYSENVNDFMRENTGADWPEVRAKAMDLLQQEASLQEIVRLVGIESLSPKEQIVLDTAKSIREDFLQQNAYDEIDTYTSVKKMYLMLKAILAFHAAAIEKAKADPEIKIEELTRHPLKEKIAKIKMVPEDKLEEVEELVSEIEKM
jgi:V/A-type H+-transporting ATPase subunit A